MESKHLPVVCFNFCVGKLSPDRKWVRVIALAFESLSVVRPGSIMGKQRLLYIHRLSLCHRVGRQAFSFHSGLSNSSEVTAREPISTNNGRGDLVIWTFVYKEMMGVVRSVE